MAAVASGRNRACRRGSAAPISTWRRFSANRLAVVGLLHHHRACWSSRPSPTCWRPIRRSSATCAAARLLPPSAAHWLGTDDQGRDILSRLIYGSRLTLLRRRSRRHHRRPDRPAGRHGLRLCRRLGRCDPDAHHRHLPRLPEADPGAGLRRGPRAGHRERGLAIAITSWPPYARIARAETLTVRNSDYIAAVQLMGASPFRIVLRHIMPLCISSLIVRVTLDMAGIILTAAGLGFLGLGAQPPLPEWGAMIASGRRFILDQWWVAGMPGRRHPDRQPRLQPARRRPARRARSAGGRPMKPLLTVDDLSVSLSDPHRR